MINRLPPLRELDLDKVPSGIQDGQLRHLETLHVSTVDDWSWLIRETAASLKFLHFMVGPCYVVPFGYSYLRPQDSLDRNTCSHIANLTNLVSLFIDDIDMWMDEPVSFLAMLSNLTQLETLHLHSISNTTCVGMVSPV